MKEYTGQFPSKNCHCHIQEPYGFVPEAGCEEHDTAQFFEFLDKIKQIPTHEGKQMWVRASDLEYVVNSAEGNNAKIPPDMLRKMFLDIKVGEKQTDNITHNLSEFVNPDGFKIADKQSKTFNNHLVSSKENPIDNAEHNNRLCVNCGQVVDEGEAECPSCRRQA